LEVKNSSLLKALVLGLYRCVSFFLFEIIACSVVSIKSFIYLLLMRHYLNSDH
jgi:hypothetical protein